MDLNVKVSIFHYLLTFKYVYEVLGRFPSDQYMKPTRINKTKDFRSEL